MCVCVCVCVRVYVCVYVCVCVYVGCIYVRIYRYIDLMRLNKSPLSGGCSAASPTSRASATPNAAQGNMSRTISFNWHTARRWGRWTAWDGFEDARGFACEWLAHEWRARSSEKSHEITSQITRQIADL